MDSVVQMKAKEDLIKNQKLKNSSTGKAVGKPLQCVTLLVRDTISNKIQGNMDFKSPNSVSIPCFLKKNLSTALYRNGSVSYHPFNFNIKVHIIVIIYYSWDA